MDGIALSSHYLVKHSQLAVQVSKYSQLTFQTLNVCIAYNLCQSVKQFKQLNHLLTLIAFGILLTIKRYLGCTTGTLSVLDSYKFIHGNGLVVL